VPIDPAHPIIEAIAAAIGLVALLVLPGVPGLFVAASGWLLVALAILDLRYLWLPDRLTAALGVAGLAAWLAGLAPPLADRIAGGIAGYGALALIAWLYRRVRGREGLGAGDAKLLAAIGLWTGWQPLPLIVLGASVAGLAGAGLWRLAGRPVAAQTALPFGCLLALAAWPIVLFTIPG
jgi:leader peptidase (prepilin peptidase)/N-methyltransferase